MTTRDLEKRYEEARWAFIRASNRGKDTTEAYNNYMKAANEYYGLPSTGSTDAETTRGVTDR